jgi:hypothetical protein
MSQPPPPGKTPPAPARTDARRAAPGAPADPADTAAVPDADPSKRNVRAVGPTFIPTR